MNDESNNISDDLLILTYQYIYQQSLGEWAHAGSGIKSICRKCGYCFCSTMGEKPEKIIIIENCSRCECKDSKETPEEK